MREKEMERKREGEKTNFKERDQYIITDGMVVGIRVIFLTP